MSILPLLRNFLLRGSNLVHLFEFQEHLAPSGFLKIPTVSIFG